ncbi:MAG: M15 family metallopeptidase [Clostridia bacterium]|nr:M15 family metallopeptidase [Clostridia bacterium]
MENKKPVRRTPPKRRRNLKKKKNGMKFMWILVVALICVIGVLVVRLFNNQDVETPPHIDLPGQEEDQLQEQQTPVTPEETPEQPEIPQEPIPQIPEQPEPTPEVPSEKVEYVDASDPTIYPVVANVTVIDTQAPYTMLVNPWNKLPEGYEPDIITRSDGHKVHATAAEPLQKMLNDAWAEGLKPIVCSSFRTETKQKNLFANEVNSYIRSGYTRENAITEAAKWVANPGTSEHQTGLAVDIVSLNYQVLDKKQEDTPEQKWLMENSYKYGFILRYPSNKSDITGIYYEPWHYRYVGVELAEEVYTSGLCLEEVLALKLNPPEEDGGETAVSDLL